MWRTENYAPALCLVLLGLWTASAHPQDPAELGRQLDALRAEIAQIQIRLSSDLAGRDELAAALATSERQLAALGLELRDTRQELSLSQSRLNLIEERIQQAQAQSAQAAQALAGQLRLAYQQGSPSRLKILLNQDDPRRLNRHMAYHGYLTRARVELLDKLQQSLLELARQQTELNEETRHLLALERRQHDELATQEQLRAERDQVLADLDARIESQAERLAALEQDAQELTELLEELERALREIPMDVEIPSVLGLKGKLPRPVAGPLLNRFGQARGGEVRWNGWLIGAAGGSEVRAIAHGRVAYADWLRGYGMLIILDHGDGIMSLYGHNESLLHSVGDWVEPGAPIATVGQSGGASEPALYFELRQNGRPADPAGWLGGS